MAFSNFTETRVTVLFNWWKTNNVGEYLLTLMAIIAVSIVYQGIRMLHIREVLKSSQRVSHNLDSTEDVDIHHLSEPLVPKKREKGGSTTYSAALGTASYTLGLLLMLVVSIFFHMKYSIYH